MATSVFLTNRRCLIGTALSFPSGSTEYPQTDAYMYWPTGVSGPWPTGDLANYSKHKEMWGVRKPNVVRVYQNNPFATTGVTGSAGSYGMIQSDWRAIHNDGCFLSLTFKWPNPLNLSADDLWQTIANNLNATGDNSYKQSARNLAQNLRRYHADTGLTAAIRKIMLGFHHEGDNDGTAAPYIAASRAIITYLAKRGVGDLEYVSNSATAKVRVTLDGADAPGGAVTDFVDAFEWQTVIVGDTDARFGFWPGDNYSRWMKNDPYCWGGGQSSPGGNGGSGAHVGRVPQPGDTSGKNYGKPWKALRSTVGIVALLKWSDVHPDVVIGLGEFATSEYVDQFTGGANATLRLPKIASALPGAKGDWYRGVAKMVRGDGYESSIIASNSFAADPRCKRIKSLEFWHDQAAMPRWFNTVPFQPGDITGPSTTGAARSETYDGFVAMVNDTWFDVIGGTVVTDPTNVTLTSSPDVSSGREYTFTSTATPGSGTLTQATFDFGDGSTETVLGAGPATVAHLYPSDGERTVRVTWAASDGGSAAREQVITVISRNEDQALIEPYSGAPLIPGGNVFKVVNLGLLYNEAMRRLGAFTHERTTRRLIKKISANYTFVPEDVGMTLVVTAAANITMTIPANATAAFPSGGMIDILQWGAGVPTIATAAGVTLARAGLPSPRAQNSRIHLMQMDAADSWWLGGDLGAATSSGGGTGGGTGTTDNLFIFDFNEGPAGAELSLTGWSSQDSAAAEMHYNSDAVEGAFSARLNVSGQRSIYRKNFTSTGLGWFAFYLKLDNVDFTNTVYLMEWFNVVSGVLHKVGDLRLNGGGSLSLRDNITAIEGLTSPALPAASWARVAVRVAPGSTTGHELRTYVGANRHGTTPDFAKSGPATSNGQTALSGVRLGSMTSTTIALRYDRFRGNSTVEPSPLAA